MNSTTSLVAKQCRLNQWTEQIRDYQNRPNGMAVTEWCSLHGITKANYYYRLRQVRKACLKTVPEEQLPQSIVPIPQAYFAWLRENAGRVPQKGKTGEGFSYSLNQEEYLKRFLEHGEVPMDNNAAEQSVRGFCIGKKNWVMIDTIAGVKSSAIIYSIAETAKANNLKPYEYFEYLLTEIPQHLDETDRSFCEDLLPWSEKLSAGCRK